MNHTIKQHYVPQFLLRKFCSSDDKHIWCFDKIWMKSENKFISGVAFEKHFYDQVQGQKEDSLEYLFQKAETDAAPIILKIIEKKDLNSLTIDEKTVISLFITLQLNRTKSALKNTERQTENFIEPIKNLAIELNTKLDFEQIIPKQLWFSMLMKTPVLCVPLTNKIWVLFESNKKFYTSDNPVVLQNTKNSNPHRGTLGINSDGIEIYFPLNPSLVLCLLCERTYGLLTEKKMLCDADNIENINSLQVIYSEQYIFSSQNDFELVADMINKGEV